MRITFSEKSKNVGTDPQKYASSTKTSYLAISDGSVGMGALLRPLCQNCQVGLRDLPGWSEVGPGKIRTNPRTSTRIPKKYASSPKTSYLAIADGSVGVGALLRAPVPELSSGSAGPTR